MQDARLIARLRRGEREAIAGLQETWRDAVWSICCAMAPRGEVPGALASAIWRGLKDDARGWSANRPICCHLAGLVARALVRRLDLPQPDQESFPPSPADHAVEAHEVLALVATFPPANRLVFLLDLYFECPADALSDATGVLEPALRAARAAATFRLVPPGPVARRLRPEDLARLPDLLADDLLGPPAERLRELSEEDADLEALLDAILEAREVCRAVLHQTPIAPVEPAAAGAGADPIGASGGAALGLLAVALAFFVSALPTRPAGLGPLLAAHQSAVGRAPGFIPAGEPQALSAQLRGRGATPAAAVVDDWSSLRLRLKGGLISPGDGLGVVTLYGLDGRMVTIQELPALPDLGEPEESWLVDGVRLMAWHQGEVGLVLMSELAVGRVRAFGSTMPPGQLLALLAWGVRAEGR